MCTIINGFSQHNNDDGDVDITTVTTYLFISLWKNVEEMKATKLGHKIVCRHIL